MRVQRLPSQGRKTAAPAAPQETRPVLIEELIVKLPGSLECISIHVDLHHIIVLAYFIVLNGIVGSQFSITDQNIEYVTVSI